MSACHGEKSCLCASPWAVPGILNLIDNPVRMRPQFDHLATYSDSSRPSVTRMVFSDWDVQARRYIKGLMEEAGLTVREDVMGNTFGRWEGSDPSAGMLLGVCTALHVANVHGLALCYALTAHGSQACGSLRSCACSVLCMQLLCIPCTTVNAQSTLS